MYKDISEFTIMGNKRAGSY